MKQNIISILMLTLTVFTSCQQKTINMSKTPVRVKIEQVKTQNNIGQLSYVGVVEESQSTAVSFTTMGIIQQLIAEGQSVNKGDFLARIDETDARNMLKAAEASCKQAEDAISRYKQLYDKGSLSEANWVEAQSKLEQARSTYAIAQKQVADCRLKAPCSGVIGKRSLNTGETALPSQPVVTILDIDTVKIKISVPEREMAMISDTSKTTILIDAIEGKTFNGICVEKGVQADPMTHTYAVRIKLANEDKLLLPGMVAKAYIDGTKTQSITIPISAVQQLNSGEKFVWTTGTDSVAHRTIITTGSTIGNRISINSGLHEGDKIITDGFQKISEGSKVEIL